ncbi:MAG TPA: hypothetical protein VN670_08955 [Acidobacteriaceae bacterium]|nr:hypothetical protein [Acidobacteriaceae bacterium]
MATKKNISYSRALSFDGIQAGTPFARNRSNSSYTLSGYYCHSLLKGQTQMKRRKFLELAGMAGMELAWKPLCAGALKEYGTPLPTFPDANPKWKRTFPSDGKFQMGRLESFA